MDFPTRMRLFLKSCSQRASFVSLSNCTPINRPPGIQVHVNPALPAGTAVLVGDHGQVTFLTDIAENCEICGEPGAEARDDDGDSNMWCFACFVEQCPEEAYP